MATKKATKIPKQYEHLVQRAIEEKAWKMIDAAVKEQAATILTKLDEFLQSPEFTKMLIEAAKQELEYRLGDGIENILSYKQSGQFHKNIAAAAAKHLGLE